MAHTVTEVDTYTATITVPDGADSRSNAAEVVQDIAQALANRTHHHKLHGAFIDSPNTFTALNIFSALVEISQNIEAIATDANVGAFVVRTAASADAHAGNKYRAVFGANIGGGRYVNGYSGLAASQAQFVIALNGVWDTVNQRWFKDDTGSPAFALLMDFTTGTVTFSRQDGAGTWTSWATLGTSSLVVGTALLDNLVAASNITAGADLIVSGAATVDGNIETTAGVIQASNGFISLADYILPAGNRVKYASLVAQFRRIRIAAGTSPQPVSAVAFDGSKWTTFATAYVICIPLPEFANGSEIGLVWIRYDAAGANGTVELVRVEINDWLVTPSGATPTETVLATATLTTTGSGIKTVVATLGTPEVMSHGSYDYFIRLTGAASSTHNIYGAGLTIKPFGPGID